MKDALIIFFMGLGVVAIGFLCIAFPYIVLPAAGIIVLLWFLIRSAVKSAVKDALREYEKEKAEADGQK